MASQQASVDYLSQVPTEILHEIVKEAITTFVDACDDPERCYFHTAGLRGPIQNPDLALPMASRALNNAYATVRHQHGITLGFCSSTCATWKLRTVGLSMFADVRTITFKRRVNTAVYTQISEAGRLEAFKMRKQTDLVQYLTSSIGKLVIGKGLQCTSQVSRCNPAVTELVWLIPVA